MRSLIETRVADRLAELDRAGLGRRSPTISDRQGTTYLLGDRRVVGFCSNDYLGFADEAPANLGGHECSLSAGSGASRLISGDLPELRELEAELAELVGTDSAVLFPSGFQVNTGVPGALIEPDDRVCSDRLNHASLIDGLRLSSAKVEIIEHHEAPRLATPPPQRVQWWFSESIFSMEGDMIDLSAARSHVARGGALYLDEAHSFGLVEGGSTLSKLHDLHADVVVGTLGKAVGAAGAFVGTSTLLAAWIRARARSFVFTTGFSPLLAERVRVHIAALRGALGDARREQLWTNVRLLERLLGRDRGSQVSPIFPLVIGDNTRAVMIGEDLLARGWHIQAIRPPTVPAGSARLRLTVSALHKREEIEGLAADLRDVFSEHGLPLTTP